MKRNINLKADSDDTGLRVDIFIKTKEDSLSRTRIKNLILKKKLRIKKYFF